MFRLLAVLGLIAATAGAAQANCIGSSSLSTCYDYQTGNSYTSQSIGSTTFTSGSNARTGSTWSQTDQTIGSTTFTNGRAANGNSWSATQQDLGGGMSTYSGRDSRGNAFSGTCTGFGCN